MDRLLVNSTVALPASYFQFIRHHQLDNQVVKSRRTFKMNHINPINKVCQGIDQSPQHFFFYEILVYRPGSSSKSVGRHSNCVVQALYRVRFHHQNRPPFPDDAESYVAGLDDCGGGRRRRFLYQWQNLSQTGKVSKGGFGPFLDGISDNWHGLGRDADGQPREQKWKADN